MKVKITILVLFTILTIENIFSQYLPMVQENKYWIHQRYYNSKTGQVAVGFLINFEGDTILNSTYYKKVWQQHLSGTHPCPMGFMPCFVFDQPYTITTKYLIGFIREDTLERKVYYKSGQFCNTEEYLLFDFSLMVNDELDECKKEALGGEPEFGIIYSISYGQHWGVTRKVFHTTGYVNILGWAYTGQVNIIESIGFDMYGLFHGSYNLTGLYDYCEGTLSDCNIISHSNDPTDKEGITFYPNPTSDKIYVSDDHQIASVKAFNVSGQEINVVWHGNTIDLNGMVSGFYILKLKTTTDKIYIAKVLRE